MTTFEASVAPIVMLIGLIVYAFSVPKKIETVALCTFMVGLFFTVWGLSGHVLKF